MKKFLIIVIALLFMEISLSANAETVVYNPKTGIYHSQNCSQAKRCKTCIKIEKQQAKQQGGRACKSYGG